MSDLDKLLGEEKVTVSTVDGFNREEWIKRKQEDKEAAFSMLEEAANNLNNSDTLTAYLEIQSKFDRYSVSNALLVSHQCPDATRLYDTKTLQAKGLYVKKGERAIIVLEPGKEYKRQDGKAVAPYNAKRVFDISQTNAEQNHTQKPTGKDERSLVKALVKASPVSVQISYDLREGIKAMYVPKNKTILIRRGMEGDEIFRSLAKEIAFARLDRGDYRRETSELAAQAIAYIVCKRMGVIPEPISSLDKDFLSLSPKEKRSELSKVRDNANAIVNSLIKALEAKEVDRGAR